MARITRRKFLQYSGAAGMAGILASHRAPVFAQANQVHILRWNDFVPAADKVRGYARFVDDTTLAVTDLPGHGDAEVTIKAAQFVIATGSSPNVPPVWRALGDRPGARALAELERRDRRRPAPARRR